MHLGDRLNPGNLRPFDDLPYPSLCIVRTHAYRMICTLCLSPFPYYLPLRDGVLAAVGVAEAIGKPMLDAPWLMMSVNDDEEDPHFRKAAFDPTLCPTGGSMKKIKPLSALYYKYHTPPRSPLLDWTGKTSS